MIFLRLCLVLAIGCVCSLFFLYLSGDWKREEEELRKNGCHCPRKWFFFTIPSPECPVHGPSMTVAEHEDWTGASYVTFPTSEVERVPICPECLSEHLQEDYLLFYHKRVCGTRNDREWPLGCAVCHRSALCAMVPKILVDDWLNGRLFHTRWRDEHALDGQ